MELVKLGQILTHNTGEQAIAQEDAVNGRVLVRIAAFDLDECWNLDDIVEIEDRQVIKILKNGVFDN